MSKKNIEIRQDNADIFDVLFLTFSESTLCSTILLFAFHKTTLILGLDDMLWVSQDRKVRMTLTALPADFRLAELPLLFLSECKAEGNYEGWNIQGEIILTSMLGLLIGNV